MKFGWRLILIWPFSEINAAVMRTFDTSCKPDRLRLSALNRAREGFDIGEHKQLSPHRWNSSRFDGLLFSHNVQFDQID